MTATLIGYARCSTDKQDLVAQRAALLDLGVADDRIYLDRGPTGTTRGDDPRPRRRRDFLMTTPPKQDAAGGPVAVRVVAKGAAASTSREFLRSVARRPVRGR